MYCMFCGKEIPNDTRFCGYCGHDQQVSDEGFNTLLNTNTAKPVWKKWKIIIPSAIALVIIGLVIIVLRSCNNESIAGIWAYDILAEDNSEDFQLGTDDLILYLHSDGSVVTTSAYNMAHWAITDGYLKLTRPLGTTYYYEFSKKGERLTLVDNAGNVAVFKNCKTIQEAEEKTLDNAYHTKKVSKSTDTETPTKNSPLTIPSASPTSTPTPNPDKATNGVSHKEDIYKKIDEVTQTLIEADDFTIEEGVALYRGAITDEDIKVLRDELTYTNTEKAGVTFMIPDFFQLENVEDRPNLKNATAYTFEHGIVALILQDITDENVNGLSNIEDFPTDISDYNDAQLQTLMEYMISYGKNGEAFDNVERYEVNGTYCAKIEVPLRELADVDGTNMESAGDTIYNIYFYVSRKGLGRFAIVDTKVLPEEFMKIVEEIAINAGIAEEYD